MKTYKAVLAALAVISTASAAHADLSQHGAVGLPLNPTAQLPPENTWRVQANYYDLGEGTDNGNPQADFRQFGLYAAGRIGNRLEINGGIEKMDLRDITDNDFETLDRNGFALGAKYLLTRESTNGVAVAIGAGYSRAYAKNIHAYIVGTKSFGRGITEGRAPITGHLGLRWDRTEPEFDDAVGDEAESNKASIFAGIEVPFTRSGDWSFVGELQSKSWEKENYDPGHPEAKAAYSASVRYRPAGKGFSASLGWQRRGFPQSSVDGGLFAQIGYTFGEGEGTENEGGAAVSTTTTTTTVTP